MKIFIFRNQGKRVHKFYSKLIYPLFVTCLVFFNTGQAADSENFNNNEYFCTPESTVVFFYDAKDKKWGPATIKNSEFMVLKSETNSHFSYTIQRSDSDRASYFCEEFNQYGFIRCGDLGFTGVKDIQFKFNAKNKRYILWNVNGYFNVPTEEDRMKMMKENAISKRQNKARSALSDLPIPTDETSSPLLMEIGTCKKM